MPTASSFAGITATILAETIGRDGAAAFLHELAEELAEDQDPGWGGRA